jgi:hypothetical protein
VEEIDESAALMDADEGSDERPYADETRLS